jgi:hypothetical protein
VAGASDTRLSIDSDHHSYVSHRSRWSTAATVATTIAPNLARHHFDPPLAEELSGGSSGETTPVAPNGSTHSQATHRVEFTGSTRMLNRSASLPRPGIGSSSSSHVGSRNGRSSTASLAGAAVVEAAAHADGGDAGRLPPRLVVFNPDGAFEIGVDKAREAELQAAGELLPLATPAG